MKNGNEHTLKEVLQEMIKVYKLKSKLQQTKIVSLWEETMGTTIARYTSDIYIRRQKLYVTLNSASLKQELSYGREKILKNLNEALGEDYLQDVILK